MKLESHRLDVIEFAKQIQGVLNSPDSGLEWSICTSSIIIATMLADIADELLLLRVLLSPQPADDEEIDKPDTWRS